MCKMKSVLLLVLCAALAAASSNQNRIVGGTLTTINQYPYGAVLQSSYDFSYYEQECGGTIINNRSILTAAHCLLWTTAANWRVRLGSSFASSGGTLYSVQQALAHPKFSPDSLDYDFLILRLSSTIIYSENVAPAYIAGPNYNLQDNSVVWAIGWGLTESFGLPSEQLRQVQMWTVNQDECRTRYGTISDQMLCAGWLDVGGRDQCQGDSGGPLIHMGVVVGLCSFGGLCGQANKPGVNARVSSASLWIRDNA